MATMNYNGVDITQSGENGFLIEQNGFVVYVDPTGLDSGSKKADVVLVTSDKITSSVDMLSSVLNSERAIQVNIQIMRAFIKLRQMLVSHEELCKKIENMEKRYDAQFQAVFVAIKQLLKPPEKPKRKIGFYG